MMIPGWLDAMEMEVRDSLGAAEHFSVRELAEAMGVSEESAVNYVTLLASSGRLHIEAVSFPHGPTLAAGDARLTRVA